MDWQNLDILKFTVKCVPFQSLAREFRVALGMEQSQLRRLLTELGLAFPEDQDNPDIYFVVTQDEYEDMKSYQKREPSMSALLGASPSVALTEEMARHRFEVRVKNHNEKLSL